MIAYVREIAGKLVTAMNEEVLPGGGDHLSVHLESWFRTLAEELDRLDPRDFLPAGQFEFVNARRRVRLWKGIAQGRWEQLYDDIHFAKGTWSQTLQIASEVEGSNDIRWQVQSIASNPDKAALIGAIGAKELANSALRLCEKISKLLDTFAGDGSRAMTRSFAFVQNPDLRRIIERDYRELSLKLFPSGAWKSTVVMAGSILEAILRDQLTRDAKKIALAIGAAKAPRMKGGAVRNIMSLASANEWKLKDYIEVAAEIQVIPPHQAKSIDQVLRDYRNLVHPRKELSQGYDCAEGVAMQSFGSLNTVCDHLSRTGSIPP